jgi:hypothetical protein
MTPYIMVVSKPPRPVAGKESALLLIRNSREGHGVVLDPLPGRVEFSGFFASEGKDKRTNPG